jgi:hypothetical protein
LFRTHSGRCTESKCKYGATCRELSGRKWKCACEYDCESVDTRTRRDSRSIQGDADEWTVRTLDEFPELKRRQKTSIDVRRTVRGVGRPTSKGPVCGSDRITYSSECSLNAFQCRLQRRVGKLHDGPCVGPSRANHSSRTGSAVGSSVTQQPVRRSTLDRTTRDPNASADDLTEEHSTLYATPTQSTAITDEAEVQSIRTFDSPIATNHVQSPLFTGRSWARFERLRAYQQLNIDLQMIVYSDTGLVLYNGQSPTGQGDFVSLALHNGHVELRFNLGSGPTVLRSSVRLKKYRPIRVQVRRDGRRAWLRVEGQTVNVTADGQLSSLDLNEHLFVGYMPDAVDRVWENVALTGKYGPAVQGLVGCVLRLRVNGKRLRFADTGGQTTGQSYDVRTTDEEADESNNEIVSSRSFVASTVNDNMITGHSWSFDGIDSDRERALMRLQAGHRLAECGGTPTRATIGCEQHNPCVRPSVCVHFALGSFDCVCPTGSLGCWALDASGQKSTELSPIDFHTDSYLQLHTLTNVAAAFVLELWFLPRSSSGLLLYNGQRASATHSGDFVALQLVDSHAQFVFDLGSKIPNQRYVFY